jgi:glycosyltransferase involved in cell wall biosynthesis
MKVSIVVPVYNEKKTILEILKRVQNVYIDKEIIIVDDFSTDAARDILIFTTFFKILWNSFIN